VVGSSSFRWSPTALPSELDRPASRPIGVAAKPAASRALGARAWAAAGLERRGAPSVWTDGGARGATEARVRVKWSS
jgi:hypothetical protein